MVSTITRSSQKLPTSAVAQRYNVSSRTIERWTEKASLSFPQPMIVNSRKYWSERELDAWDSSRVKRSA
jgi:predicted DNA-binding transcriptional regulator AlpA